MTPPLELRTQRLRLRRWRASDLAPFAALNADPRVREHFPGLLSRAESNAYAAKVDREFDARGFGLWAVELPGAVEFAGFVGLSVPSFEAPFQPCVELGWRLAHECWGRGYATEAARAVVQDAFGRLGLRSLVAFTVPANVRSLRVMQKLGMTHDPRDDFEHPLLPEGHPLRRHVLWRLRLSE